MPRGLWTGSLSFGLVNVPVTIRTAVRDLDLHFRQLHAKDGAPIEVQRVCSKEDVEVPYEEIGHGFELEDGGQVVLSDEELEAAMPEKTRTIEIERFVAEREIDPVYFDHPYFLLPASSDDGAVRAYRLLVEVMAQTERAALGRFVMRAREYMAVIRSQPEDWGAARRGRSGRRGGNPPRALQLTTMRFADEIRSTDDVGAPSGRTSKPTAKQLEAAVAVIEGLSTEWEPEEYVDRYRKRLQNVVARKRKGQTIKAPSEDDRAEPAPDLMEALERTLATLAG
jgi:DNA end-binding protein Ku